MCRPHVKQQPILSVDNLSIGYKKNTLCTTISFDIFAKEMVALVGRNGCGKSTFLKTLVNIVQPLKGSFFYHTGRSIAQSVAVVFTSFSTFDYTSIHDIIAMGRIPYTNPFNRLNDEDEHIIQSAFSAVHLNDTISIRQNFNTLSDGQKQKVLIAKAIAQHTPVILLDEPTSFLDIPSRKEILSLLNELVQKGHTVLISTHEIELVSQYANRFITFIPPNVSILDREQATTQHILQHMFDV